MSFQPYSGPVAPPRDPKPDAVIGYDMHGREVKQREEWVPPDDARDSGYFTIRVFVTVDGKDVPLSTRRGRWVSMWQQPQMDPGLKKQECGAKMDAMLAPNRWRTERREWDEWRDASASGRWKRVRYLIVLQDIGFVPAGEGG